MDKFNMKSPMKFENLNFKDYDKFFDFFIEFIRSDEFQEIKQYYKEEISIACCPNEPMEKLVQSAWDLISN